jgi:hypothetical protein
MMFFLACGLVVLGYSGRDLSEVNVNGSPELFHRTPEYFSMTSNGELVAEEFVFPKFRLRDARKAEMFAALIYLVAPAPGRLCPSRRTRSRSRQLKLHFSRSWRAVGVKSKHERKIGSELTIDCLWQN